MYDTSPQIKEGARKSATPGVWQYNLKLGKSSAKGGLGGVEQSTLKNAKRHLK